MLVTIRKRDQVKFIETARRIEKLGFKFMATDGTANLLKENGIKSTEVKKIENGTPNILDIIKEGKIDIIINIHDKTNNHQTDGFKIRRVASETNTTLLTSLDTVNAMLTVIEKEIKDINLDVWDIGNLLQEVK